MAEHRHFRIPAWDERLSPDILAKRRAELGVRDFDRGYRQRAYSDQELLWKADAIERCRDPKHVVVEAITPNLPFASMSRVCGVDLAIATESDEAAYFVAVAMAVDADNVRWVLNLFRARVGFNEQVQLLQEWHERYQFQQIKVERNGYQKAILDHTQRQLPVAGLYTGAAQLRDLEIGLPSLALEFERGLWRIPVGDAKSRRVCEPLLEELATYPGGSYCDTVMALYFARECVRQAKNAMPRVVVLA
jgi:phage terminase large subunit-like protein